MFAFFTHYHVSFCCRLFLRCPTFVLFLRISGWLCRRMGCHPASQVRPHAHADMYILSPYPQKQEIFSASKNSEKGRVSIPPLPGPRFWSVILYPPNFSRQQWRKILFILRNFKGKHQNWSRTSIGKKSERFEFIMSNKVFPTAICLAYSSLFLALEGCFHV